MSTENNVRLTILEGRVDDHDKALYGDHADLGLRGELKLIQHELSQMKWGIRIITGACIAWVITNLLGLLK